jgi:tetratricopeptide (TPR) repeat protein
MMKKIHTHFFVFLLACQALTFFAGCSEYYHDRGYKFYLKDDYDNAIACFTKAVELDPNDFSSYHYRAKSYAEKMIMTMP